MQCFRSDKEVVLAAMRQKEDALELASDGLRNDREFVMQVLRDYSIRSPSGGSRVLKFASTGLQSDREVVLVAVYRDGDMLEFASYNLRLDTKILLEAVRGKGCALMFAGGPPPELTDVEKAALGPGVDAFLKGFRAIRASKEVVLAAVTQDGMALRYASYGLRMDKDVLLAAVWRDGNVLQLAGGETLPGPADAYEIEVLGGREQAEIRLAALRATRVDKDVVLAAVRQCGRALQFAKEYQNDRDVVLAAVWQDGRALEFAPGFKGNKEVVIAAIKNDCSAYDDFASDDLKLDAEVQKEYNFKKNGGGCAIS